MYRGERNGYEITVSCWPKNEIFFQIGIKALVEELPYIKTGKWEFLHLCGHNLQDFILMLPSILYKSSNRKIVIVTSPRMLPLAAYLGLNTRRICGVIRSDAPLADFRVMLKRAAEEQSPAISKRMCASFSATDFRNLCFHFGLPHITWCTPNGVTSRSGYYRYRERLTMIFGVKKLERLVFTY